MSALHSTYSDVFYDREAVASLNGAARILPYLSRWLDIGSVLDVGCGVGAFLSWFRRFGVKDHFGIDGAWVPQGQLLVAKENFKAVDLTEQIDLGRKFDLVISLEVAEHIQEGFSDRFVDNICRHGNVVMFSACIPAGAGDGHVNEQWQSYWAAKFADRGYKVLDLVRPCIQEDGVISSFYRQNCLLYANEEGFLKFPRLKAAADRLPPSFLDTVVAGNGAVEITRAAMAKRIQEARAVLQTDPTNVDAVWTISALSRQLGLYDEARDILKAIGGMFGNQHWFLVERAEIAVARRELEECLTTCASIRDLYPNSSAGYRLAVRALQDHGFSDRANSLLELAIEALTWDSWPLLLALQNTWPRQDWQQAIRLSEQLLRRFPDERACYHEGGYALFRLRRLDESKALALKGMERFPDDFRWLRLLMWIEQERKDWHEVRKWASEWRRRFPAMLDSYDGEAGALRELGLVSDADTVLREAQRVREGGTN